jgi:hypothetical protein
MNEDLRGALRAYAALMKSGAYFEAHEALEEAWHPLRLRKDPRANLAKGLINAAIALEHLRRNRPKSRINALKTVAAFDRYKGLCREGMEAYEEFAAACAIAETLRKEAGI